MKRVLILLVLSVSLCVCSVVAGDEIARQEFEDGSFVIAAHDTTTMSNIKCCYGGLPCCRPKSSGAGGWRMLSAGFGDIQLVLHP
jgi:hypothetical protein